MIDDDSSFSDQLVRSEREPDQRRQLPVQAYGQLEAVRGLLGRQLHANQRPQQRQSQVSGKFKPVKLTSTS